MKKNSIFFTITVTFIFSILLIVISFSVLYQSMQEREKFFMNKQNSSIAQMVLRESMHQKVSSNLQEYLEQMNFTLITNPMEQQKLLKDKNLTVERVSKKRRMSIEYLKIKGRYLVHIHTPRNKILLINNNTIKNHQYKIFVIFIVILLAFIFLYTTTIKKLKPLKQLQKKVKNFGEEEFDVDCRTSNEDEISLLANEFDAAAKKLKKLKDSRNIFIRNIMHELKTPITKGRFLTQLPKTEQNSETMDKVFYRLESLINEFASIEELISSKKDLNSKEYYLQDLVDNAMDILMCDEMEVTQEFDNIKLNVEFDLFSIAIKNLLDNALKYSSNKNVTIKTQGNSIVFQNQGEPLKYPLQSYFEPFFKGNEVKSNQSFGLGLYIIKHILDAHGYILKYDYEEGVNRFLIK